MRWNWKRIKKKMEEHPNYIKTEYYGKHKVNEKIIRTSGMEAKLLMEFDNKYDDIEKHFNQIMDEFAKERYENVNPMSELELHQQAIDDFKNIQKMSRGMKNGKATTPWGIPAEVWKIVLNP